MVYDTYKSPAFAPASYQYKIKKMEDIKQSFNEINEMLQSVVSKMAAASQPGQSQCLPVIAEILHKMEMIVSSQVSSVQSESGYDSSSCQDDVSVSSISPSIDAIPSPISNKHGCAQTCRKIR